MLNNTYWRNYIAMRNIFVSRCEIFVCRRRIRSCEDIDASWAHRYMYILADDTTTRASNIREEKYSYINMLMIMLHLRQLTRISAGCETPVRVLYRVFAYSAILLSLSVFAFGEAADIADVFRILLLGNNIIIRITCRREHRCPLRKTHYYFFFFFPLSIYETAESRYTRIRRVLRGLNQTMRLLLRSRKFSMLLHVCFLVEQNFQNYCFLLLCMADCITRVSNAAAFSRGRILRAPSPLRRIAWQHSRRVI